MDGGAVEQKFRLEANNFDWMARRLTPRRFYPPKRGIYQHIGDRPLTNADVNPKPVKLIEIPDIEAIGVQVGKYKGNLCLLLQLGLSYPFREDRLVLARKSKAQWNDTFNLWEIPIFSQHKKVALQEAWGWLEQIFFELNWNFAVVPIYWNYSVPDSVISGLRKKLDQLNSFWETGEVAYQHFSQPALVYSSYSRAELEDKALDSFYSLYPPGTQFEKEIILKQTCVNYLRHKESAYHLLLAAKESKRSYSEYLAVFRKINKAIALAYPWLSQECERQNSLKTHDEQVWQQAGY